MLRHKTTMTAVLLVSLLILPVISTAQGLPDFVTLIGPEEVMAHVEALSVNIGARPMGSEAEADAADYVAEAFDAYGYEVEIREFETTPPSEEEEEGAETAPEPVTSRNVIATRAGDDQIVVVGAHLDSVTDGAGADDNASGVAAMLAAAEAMADVQPVHTIMFVAFGAEESGDPPGADIFVESLGDDIDNVIAMVNIDSVGAGTDLNVYAGATVTWPEDEDAAPTFEGGPTWVRDLALDLAAEMNLPFGTSPADSWSGFTGDWSDHYAFVLEGIPIVYFEAWQWQGAEDPWYGQETAEGDVIHTEDDVYENVVPEKVEMTAELVAATTFVLATGMATPPAE